MGRIQSGKEIQLGPLRFPGEFSGRAQVGDGILRGLQPRSLVNSRQEPGAPVRRVSLGQSAPFRIGHHHESGQVLRQTPETIGDPGTDTGEAHPRKAGVHHEQRRRMIVGIAESGMNKRHLVHVRAKVRKNLGHHLPALPPGCEVKGRLHQAAHRVLEETGGVREGRIQLLNGFSVPPGQSGFVIPSIHLAWSAVDENPNYVLGFGLKVRLTRCHRVQGTFVLKQSRERIR